MQIIKIGPVELFETEAERFFEEGRYIVTFSKIYKVTRRNGKYHGKVMHTEKGMTRRGRFYAMDAETICNVFGLQLN